MPELQPAIIARILATPAIGVGNRAFWLNVPAGTALPYLRLQIVSDPRIEHLEGYDTARVTRVQADAFALLGSEAHAIWQALIDEFEQPRTIGGVDFGHSSAVGPRDLGEDTPAGFVHMVSGDLLIEHAPS